MRASGLAVDSFKNFELKRMVPLILLAAVLPVLVTGIKTFDCGISTCHVLKGEYCNEKVCNPCTRYIHNYLDNPNTTMKIPLECAYIIHYGEQTSAMEDKIAMLQTKLESKEEWISGMEDNMRGLQTELESKNNTISKLQGLLEDKAKENQQLKDATNYYWKWIKGLAGCSSIQTLVITVMTFVIVRAAPWRAKRVRDRLPAQERGRELPKRLLQVPPTEEGRQGATMKVCG